MTAEEQLSVPAENYGDMQTFISFIGDDNTNLKQLGIGNISNAGIIERLQTAYVNI